MRRGLSTAGVILLAGLLLAGLAGCQREAPARPTDAPLAEATQVPGVPPSTSVATPRPGETVVSAFTPVPATQIPGTLPQPTQDISGGEQPGATATAPAAGAVATAVPPAQPSGATLTHTVQQGETLSSIAARYGTTVAVIAQANGITDPNSIQVGQQLKIPTGGGTSTGTTGCRIQHTVQSGEWVWQIARNYSVSPYDILAANGLTIQTANTIYPGQVLCIP